MISVGFAIRGSLCTFDFRFYTVSEWGVPELFSRIIFQIWRTIPEHLILELYKNENHNFETPYYETVIFVFIQF